MQILQRAIADYRGVAVDRPLPLPSNAALGPETAKADSATQQARHNKDTLSSVGEQKRKYRRHPKPDEHAPEKPPSAYVLFSNKVREEVKGDNMSFTDIARLVGERWQKLDPSQKDIFESHAAALKDTYNAQLADYKTTDAYQQYMDYLADFKAKHSGVTTSEWKKPRLEPSGSSSLSAASQADSMEGASDLSAHKRGPSFVSMSVTSQSGSLSESSASTLHLVTSIPSLPGPTGQHTPPPVQERQLPGRLSGQSSMSEESSWRSLELNDVVARGSQLPLGTPSSSAFASRSARQEYYSPESQALLRRQNLSNSHNFSSVAIPAVSSGSGPPSSTSGPGSAALEPWMDRSIDVVRQNQVDTSLQTSQHSASMPLSQLVDLSFGNPSDIVTQRTLPPLRQRSDTPTNPPGIFGASQRLSSSHYLNPHSDKISVRRSRSQNQTPTTSESEAADTLAGLAEREQVFDPARTPKGNSYGRR